MDRMDEGNQWLAGIADRMKEEIGRGAAASPESLTVRELLRKFGYERRGDWINNQIRNGLERHKLTTDQDFTVVWLDSPIKIELDSAVPGVQRGPHTLDPTLRIGALPAAHRELVQVKPEAPLKQATAKMQMNDYSRLPVMKHPRDVSGVVTWKSIGKRLSLGHECNFVSQCMEPPEVIPAGMRLFDAIRRVESCGYVLVREKDRTITGIVTATDLSHHFRDLAAPFLFVGEIEGHLRNLIHGKFTLNELQAASRSGNERTIEGSADLTFGGYCRLLGNKETWERMELDVDRAVLIESLKSVRDIRNNVMHFSPDGLKDEERDKLRKVARFFDQLASMTAAS